MFVRVALFLRHLGTARLIVVAGYHYSDLSHPERIVATLEL